MVVAMTISDKLARYRCAYLGIISEATMCTPIYSASYDPDETSMNAYDVGFSIEIVCCL